ncbi:Putative Atypical/BCR protein kinase [Rhizopus microsporus]|nr:Putative Atypical/BCR protein kinase [Rhizopus microsporus]
MSLTYGQDEVSHLRSQNDQLWKIIEKQRVMIQNLQKENARLSADRDGLLDKVNSLEKEMIRKQRVTSLLISPQTLKEIAEADDASLSTPSETSPVELPPLSPMPPPRSPYRPLKERVDAAFLQNEPEDIIHGRSSPGSPAPGPHSPTQVIRKDSAPLPSNNKIVVPTPSKSSSSLDRRQHQRESMMPPARAALEHDPTMRAASPPPATPSIRTTRSKRESAVLHRANSDIQQSMKNMSTPNLPTYEKPDDEPKQDNASFMGNMANIHIKLVGSNIKPNDKGKEVISFIIAIGSLGHQDEFEEKWRVEKLYSDFLTLDSKLKAQRNNRSATARIGKLPDKALFSNNAPSKVDQRKIALEQYLQHIVALPLENTSHLCEFLSTNIVDTVKHQIPGHKEGYLTKRGKNFGGWKTRYFVLNDNVLEYYESKEGNQLGSIRLTNAQIGRQMPGTTPAAEEYNNIYRHAFLIVEQRKTGSSHFVRHILCANSDDDRDEWVQALTQNIQLEDNFKPHKKKSSEKPRKLSKGEIRTVSAQPMSQVKLDNAADMEKFNAVVPAVNVHPEENGGLNIPNQPTPSISSESSDSLPTTWGSMTDMSRPSLDHSRTLHAPRPPIVRRSSMGNLITEGKKQEHHSSRPQRAASPTIITTVTSDDADNEKKARNKAHRMTFWGKKMFSSSSNSSADQQQLLRSSSSTTTNNGEPDMKLSQSNSSSTSNSSSGFRGFLSRSSHEQAERQKSKQQEEAKSAKQVFGVPLDVAVRISRINEGYELPAIVYRCIEYLDAMNAVMEEGLYRLSGSNSTMKALKERFNQEGDVNLLASKNEYDVHVVAGLLKMWLRELPTSVLTREHRTEFLHVIDLLDRKDRVNELGRLVSLLPLSNYTLLRALTAHLIRVVQHSDVNKMTMRNVSIVFSPTLGIPPTIFNLFMSEFEYIFWTTENGDAAPRMIEDEEEETKKPAPALSRKTTLRLVREEHGRSNRNSVNYMDGAPNAIVDLEKNMDGPPVLDEDEEVDDLTIYDTSDQRI